MSTEIKPCPFCGSSEEIRVSKHGMFGLHCICGASLFGFETSEEAIEKWNKRVSGWISVKDRLPEENECDCSLECLVVCRTFGGYEGSYVSIEKAIFFKDIPADECLGYYNHYWQITSGDMIIPFEVTHWQPLPEIPKC